MKSWAAIACVLSVVSTATATEFYVSPDGAASNPGTSEKPFSTLEQARDAIRVLKAKGPLTEPVRVIIAAGTYRRTAPFVLTTDDSGSAETPIVYEASPGARPIFTGGRPIGGWELAENGLWKTHIPEVANGNWYFEQLWINGRRATRAGRQTSSIFTSRKSRKLPPNLPAGKKRLGESNFDPRTSPRSPA